MCTTLKCLSFQAFEISKDADNPVPVLILDNSTSKFSDYWSRQSLVAWKYTLQIRGYKPDEEVHIIQPGTTEMTHVPLKDLDALDLPCSRGQPTLDGIVEQLEAVLFNYGNKMINIWVMSDGRAEGQEAFVNSMNNRILQRGFSESQNVNVLGVHMCHSHLEAKETPKLISEVMRLSGLFSEKTECQIGDIVSFSKRLVAVLDRMPVKMFELRKPAGRDMTKFGKIHMLLLELPCSSFLPSVC